MTNTLKITDIYNSSISEVVIPPSIPNVDNTGNITGVPIMSVSGKQNIAYIAYETGETVQITATGATSGIIQAIGKSESDIEAARDAVLGYVPPLRSTVGCWVDPQAEKTYKVELIGTYDNVGTVLGYVLPHDSSPITVTKFSDINTENDYDSTMSTTENLSFICCGHVKVPTTSYATQLPIKIFLWSANSGFFESTISSIPNWVADRRNDFSSVIVKSVEPFEAYMLVVRRMNSPIGLIIYKLSGVKETPTVEEFDFIPTPDDIPYPDSRLAAARLMNISKLPGEFELGISYLVPVPTTDPGNWGIWDESGFRCVWSSVIKVSDRQSIMDSLDDRLNIKQYNSKPVKLDTHLIQYTSVTDLPDTIVTPIVSRRGADSILIYPNMSMRDSSL